MNKSLILTFDLEEWFHLCLDDTPSSWDKYERRFEKNTDYLLETLDQNNVKATFLVLGWIARKYPEIIRKISENGHDVGSHSNTHDLVYEQSEEEFEKVKKTKISSDTSIAPPPTIGGLTPDEIQVRLKELEALKMKKPEAPVLPSKQDQPVPIAGISGTVREVNAKFGFAILDLGAPNGVKLGDEFAVSRANEPVGRLRVRKLHSGLSICDIISTQTSRAVLPGDRVDQLK